MQRRHVSARVRRRRTFAVLLVATLTAGAFALASSGPSSHRAKSLPVLCCRHCCGSAFDLNKYYLERVTAFGSDARRPVIPTDREKVYDTARVTAIWPAERQKVPMRPSKSSDEVTS